MISLKPGAVVTLSPAIIHMLDKMFEWSKANNQPLVITAGTNGKHSANSKHYIKEALDIRSHNFPDLSKKNQFVRDMTELLGSKFFIFLEAPDTANEHFHLQVRKGGSYP